MTPKKNLPDVPLEDTDRRAPDQDTAIEQTFEEGTALDVLPPEDRRHEAEPVGVEKIPEGGSESLAVVPDKSFEDRVTVGSHIVRTETGWHVALAYGGAIRLHGEGPTLAEAITAAGA